MHTSAKAIFNSVAIQIRICIPIPKIRDPDRHQNLIICSLAHCQPSLKILCKFVSKFLRKVANRQTNNDDYTSSLEVTRRPASGDRTARRQFQPTGQPVSRTQASDAMPSRLPRYEVKCVQCRCFQYGSVPLHSDIKGTELPPTNILMPLERQLIALQRCR